MIAGEGHVGLLYDFGVALLIAVSGHNDGDLGAGNQIHGTAHAGSSLTGDHPVCQVALGVYLVSAQNGGVNVTATDKAEGTEAVKAGAANAQNGRLTASVNNVGICILALLGSASQTNDTVLGVNPNVHALGQVVQALGGHTDAQVYYVAVLEEAGGSVSDQILTSEFHSIHLEVPP